jgi:hypothetical protein
MDEIHEPQYELYLSESEMRNDVEDCSAKAAASQAGTTNSPQMACEKPDASSAFVTKVYTTHAGEMDKLVVELTAEYLHVADDSDATLLQNGQSQRVIYPMNSTKTVPDMGSAGLLMPFPYEHPAAPCINEKGQEATAVSLHPAPHLLHPPVLLD